jgi:hypothetical protein
MSLVVVPVIPLLLILFYGFRLVVVVVVLAVEEESQTGLAQRFGTAGRCSGDAKTRKSKSTVKMNVVSD